MSVGSEPGYDSLTSSFLFAGFGPTLNLWAIIEGACSDQGLVFCKQRLWNYGQLGKSSPLLAWFCK